MKFIGGFFQFAQRVINAAKNGGLNDPDTKKLDKLLERTGKRNTIIAKGLLSALSAGGASEKDIARFGELLSGAELRIANDKEPFTKAEKNEIQDIFKRAYISAKTARWLSAQIDDLLAGEISEVIIGSKGSELVVPAKKTVRFEEKVGKEEDMKRRIKS